MAIVVILLLVVAGLFFWGVDIVLGGSENAPLGGLLMLFSVLLFALTWAIYKFGRRPR